MSEDLAHTSAPLGDIAAETTVNPLSPPGYELLDKIGHGGMGVVYRARDAALDRGVAFRLLSERYPAGSRAAARSDEALPAALFPLEVMASVT